jgi:hypothetical protein
VIVHRKLSPVRALQDYIPAGAGGADYGAWSGKSHTGLAQGFCINSIVGDDATTPQIIWIGFNKQPPAAFQVGDVFKFAAGFKTLEIYNNTLTGWTVSLTLFDGDMVL